MSQQKCSTTNPYDGKRCEFVSGHVGWHGYREVALAYMIGAATTLYYAGSFWRIWKP